MATRTIHFTAPDLPDYPYRLFATSTIEVPAHIDPDVYADALRILGCTILPDQP